MWVDVVLQPFTTNEYIPLYVLFHFDLFFGFSRSHLIIIGTVANAKNQPKALGGVDFFSAFKPMLSYIQS